LIKIQRNALSHFRAIPSETVLQEMIANNDIRTPFQRDRDRILYCKAFRRLARKTQVFFSGHDDHIRTRLTHTLEVSQISRTISEYLGLDIDLTEAIALGHDIGHAPFGHVGERVINLFANGCESYKDFNIRASTDSQNSNSGNTPASVNDAIEDRFMGFKHNWQAVRIVKNLAQHRRDDTGLGLTEQVVFGILFHTKLEWDECRDKYGDFCKLRERGKGVKCKNNKFSLGYYNRHYNLCKAQKHFTLEAAIVAISDEIAQRHHDLEDGLRFHLVEKDEILRLLHENRMITDNQRMELMESKDEYLINSISSIMISFYVMRTIEYIEQVIAASHARSLTAFIRNYSDITELQNSFSINRVFVGDDDVKSLLKDRVLYSYEAQGMDGRAEFILRRLFKAYISNPQQLPDSTIRAFFRIYLSNSMSINVKDLAEKLKVEYSAITQQSQIDGLSTGKLREVLKFKHTKGRHVYKGCLLRAICDLISGMTDQKAKMEYQRLYDVG